ncbi:transmembrane protein 243-like [Xenia sp. Carnegie-2017]|uniref:transmembrane protein 243-like n=1 Tax=Xenia sp. Carnegie-2017 TaxID=2897299 RepID=UPI001F039DE2|nr:transmembrane protein 243-like [Xenia sp. Carnegie-2017]
MYTNEADRPLFGEERPKVRYLNYTVGLVTSLLVLETFISAFLFPRPTKALHVFLAIVIVMVCCSDLLLIYWYRQGDLEPMFRKLIYYNSFTILLLCICANFIFHDKS